MSSYIDIEGLLRVIIISAAFGLGLALIYGVGVANFAKAEVTSGGGRSATAPRLVAGASFAVFLGAIVIGLVVMASK